MSQYAMQDGGVRRRSGKPPMLKLEGVTIQYAGRRVVDRASLQVNPGELMALLGPSGCGKSSLLNSINRMSELVAGCSVAGAVTLDGEDVRGAGMPAHRVRRRIGMVFQQANPFPMSIAENILFPLREHGERDRALLQQRLETALREVGLWNEVHQRLDSSALALSGGQQQRLCIARALAIEPQVLLFDEPCSALDPLATQHIEALIMGLKGRYTMLMVTHNLAQARRLADSVTVCWVERGCGCVIETGTMSTVMDHSSNALTQAYCNGLVG
ncbi:MAG: phosphate ABC transporter ATP-binding protein [Pseudomonadota bacterium]